MKPRYRSETDKVRWLVLPFCEGSGLDVGFGGDKVAKHFLSFDLPQPYANTGDDPLDVAGDVLDGIPAEDDTFDVVYSSHLIEDFTLEQLAKAIPEMVRVLKNKGRLILVVPDESAYRKHCAKTGQPHNFRHVHEDMGLEFLKDRVIEAVGCGPVPPLKVLFQSSCEVDYNVVLVLEVDKVAMSMERLKAELETLRAVIAERDRTTENLKAEIRGIKAGVSARESREAQGERRHVLPGEDRY